MTTAAATNFTISHTVDQDILDDLEASFEGYRSRIARLSMEACGSLTAMFAGPVELVHEPATESATVIDIVQIEADCAPRELVAARRIEGVRALTAA